MSMTGKAKWEWLRNNYTRNRDILRTMNTAFRLVDRCLQCAIAFAYAYFYRNHTEGRARP